MKYYIWYKHKAGGPFDRIDDDLVQFWKEFIKSGKANFIKDTPFLNDEMKTYPDDVHILVNAKTN